MHPGELTGQSVCPRRDIVEPVQALDVWLSSVYRCSGYPAPKPPPGQLQPPPNNATVPRPLAQRLWEIPEYRAAYLQKLKSLLEGPARPAVLLERMTALRDLIRPAVQRETRSMFTLDQFERAITSNQRTGGPGLPGMPPTPTFDIPGLEAFIRTRAANIATQLDGMLPR